jgi:hypothetical protein
MNTNNGWKLVRVNEAFSDLMFWLERCSERGRLDNCYDLVAPWEAFKYEYADDDPIDTAPDAPKAATYTVTVDPDPRGVSVGVYLGSSCVYHGAHAVPAPAAGDALTAAASDVLAERQRQISAEGWTQERDDSYTEEQLARAAACYALPQGDYEIPEPPEFWPWDPAWWKPGQRRRELVKAGALVLAEIERLDRAALSASQQGGE